MAENVYSKGTRVWFVDKDQAWISAEVTQVTKGANDAVALTFVDDRGKVRDYLRGRLLLLSDETERQETVINTTVADIKAGKEDLPPLRNPPLLETADDLATLSHLNEPSGVCCRVD
jgi:myosin-5